MAVKILQPGLLSLLQDGGRYGQHRIGLTNGGPLDPGASQLCNRLLGNAADATIIEVSFGGLQLEVLNDTFICVTGARMPLQINGKDVARYEVHPVTTGDRVTLDFAESGCRAYLGVADGFEIADFPRGFDSVYRMPRDTGKQYRHPVFGRFAQWSGRR